MTNAPWSFPSAHVISCPSAPPRHSLRRPEQEPVSIGAMASWMFVLPPPLPFATSRKSLTPHIRRTTHARRVRATITSPVKTFNWTDQWYPVALTNDLNPAKPNPLTLLSTPLVAFKSYESWVVLHDRCPHRSASLSQGRVTNHRLECSYHGWQFDNVGNVCRIPQSSDCPTLSASQIRSVMHHGILFCTLGNPIARPPLVDWGTHRFVVSEFSRLLPLCFTTVIQNLLDPAHIHFAHHGKIGRREYAAPIPIRVLAEASQEGFLADYYNGTVRLRFRPPCLVEIVTADGISFAYYTTPISRSTSKAFAIRTTAYKQWFVPPKWMDHLRRHRLLEDDLGLMQRQQNYMERPGGYHEGWKEFCTPASADRLVVEMRRWLERFAPMEEWYGCKDGTDFGRWEHTRACPSCWNVWRCLGIARRAAKVLGIGCLLVAAGLGSITLAAVAGLMGILVRALQWAHCKFE